MMETTQARAGNHRRLRTRLLFDWPVIRCVLLQGIEVEELFSAPPNQSFHDTVLPGQLEACSLGFQTRCLQEGDDLGIEFCVTVQNPVTVAAGLGEGFAELLDTSLRSRMSGHVEVQNLPASALDDKEAVKQLEGHRRHSEEVERRDHLPVIAQERQPAFAGVTAAPDSSQISSHGSFRDDEAELLQFSVDLGRAPGRIFLHQAADQRTDFSGSFRPTVVRS